MYCIVQYSMITEASAGAVGVEVLEVMCCNEMEGYYTGKIPYTRRGTLILNKRNVEYAEGRRISEVK